MQPTGTMTPTTQPENEITNRELDFIIKLGSALHTYGTPSYQLEQAMRKTMERMQVRGELFAQPTGLFVTVHSQGQAHTSIIRVEPGETNLEKLALIDELTQRVNRGEVSTEEGIAAVNAILNAPPRYGTVLQILSYSVGSATVCRFLEGGWREILVSAFIGLLIGFWAVFCGRVLSASFLFEPVAAALSAAIAIFVARKVFQCSVYEITLAGLIAALPGLTMTTAMKELAMRHLVAGTVRVAWASLVFMEIAFGVALGSQVTKLFEGPLPRIEPVALPLWTIWVALIIAPVAFAVRFNARPKDIGWISLGCIVGFGGSRLGAGILSWEFGGFVGAFYACATSNLIARLTNRPSTVVLAPSLLLLVPGSIGFVSVSSFLEKNILTGIQAGFSMIMVAMSIVIGLLLANALVPARKIL